MTGNGVPEEKIIWKDGGHEQRLEALESRTSAIAGTAGVGGTGGGGGGGGVNFPSTPWNISLSEEILVEDENGEKHVEIRLSWEGAGDMFEVAFRRK
jgi:hypothetical protein